jgi:outer membrane protein assembly factor BamD
MQIRYFIQVSMLLAILVLGSCSKFHKIQKSDDVDKKYAAALEYYEKKDFYRASILLEELIPILKGRVEAEKAQFYYANCHFNQRDYTLSSFYFKNFYETFQRSEYAEEALYMHAVSLYKDSPTYNLDQTNTVTALEAIQTFLNRYPQTPFKEECHRMQDELRRKLELKAYDNAKLYHKLASSSIIYYKSAIIAFDNFKASYPDSEFNEELAFLKIETEYNLARVSTEDKKKERFMQTIEFYETFIDKYPKSKYIKNAESIYESARAQLGNEISKL